METDHPLRVIALRLEINLNPAYGVYSAIKGGCITVKATGAPSCLMRNPIGPSIAESSKRVFLLDINLQESICR